MWGDEILDRAKFYHLQYFFKYIKKKKKKKRKKKHFNKNISEVLQVES